MDLKAVFFDRDGTLSRNSPAKLRERDAAIGALVGDPDLRISGEEHMEIFWQVQMPENVRVDTLENEDYFWTEWFRIALTRRGYPGDTDQASADLFGRFCFYRCMELFPETVEVLDDLRRRGLRLGVISDTFPSLEQSLKELGIHHYFESYTASSLAGAGKPDPRIFNAALKSLGVVARECVFVDDCLEEADGAREQGFTAFHLDRGRDTPDFGSWEIGNLSHLLDYLDGGGARLGR